MIRAVTTTVSPRFGGGRSRSLHTADGSRAAHVEHTIAITTHGPRILTLP